MGVDPKKEKEFGFDHDEIRDYIRDIGLGLGFDAETEKRMSHGVKVDVVWRIQIAKLGVINYVFAVQSRGSLDSLMMNLQKAKSNPNVQKSIVVSDKEELKLVQEEVSGLPEELRKSISLWDVEDVTHTHEHLSEALKDIKRLDLPLLDILILSRFPLRSN
jgi:hypothetical protein